MAWTMLSLDEKDKWFDFFIQLIQLYTTKNSEYETFNNKGATPITIDNGQLIIDN